MENINTSKVLKFPEINEKIKKHNEQRRVNAYHDGYWLAIHQKIVEDTERLRQRNLTPVQLVVGVEEYKTLINIFSRRDHAFTLPNKYGKIPIVLAPIVNLCAVVPSPDKFWFDFIE